MDASYFDFIPTSRPRQLDDLDLRSLAELHKFLSSEKQNVPLDFVVPRRIGGHTLAMLVDSDAACTILSMCKWQQIHCDNPELTLLSVSDRIQLASGVSLPIEGELVVKVELAAQYYLHRILVMELLEDLILGINFWRCMMQSVTGHGECSGPEVKRLKCVGNILWVMGKRGA